MTDLKYPIGKFEGAAELSPEERKKLIDQVADMPANLRQAVAGLSVKQLDTPYRPEGWTVRQLVHHIPESHMNAYIRFKLALTEDQPTIKTYHQELWAELPDSRTAPPEVSLQLLDWLHHRWTFLLRSLQPADWTRSFRHPDLGEVTLDKNLGLYAWHGRHHVAHITELRERMGWS